MKHRILAGLTLTGVAILASCSRDLTQSTAVPAAPSLARVVTPTCSFSTANNDARSYFASNKDNVFTLLNAMSTAYKGGAAAATPAGWAVLSRLADAVGTSAVSGSPAQGNTFANDVLLCMAVPTYSYPLDLSGALGPNGLFGIRDNSGAVAVTSRLIVGGAPAYGAEPSTGNWPVTSTTLFYGNQLFVSSIANETPAGTLFDLKTLPSGLTFAPEIKTGVCTISDPNARILHAHQGNSPVILPPATDLSFCPPPPTSAAQSSSSLFASAVGRLATWFAPAPANAASFVVRGGGGTGLVGGLSEIGPVSFTSLVTFTVKPKNTSVSKSPQQFVPTVTVQNLTAKGNALKGVTITLSVTSNNGSFHITGNTATTDVNGIATFPDLKIDKAGGYTMTAVSEVGGAASVFFNINGQ
jgi:hypothetical protein